MIVQVKDNQPALFKAVQQAEGNAVPRSQARNRLEWRTVRVFGAAPLLAEHPPWLPLVATVIQVHRRTDCFETRTGAWKRRTETAYYVATDQPPAAVFAEFIRGHWGIENRHHYGRDVTLREEASRLRRHPGIVARLRRFTLDILRKHKITNISEALYGNALRLDNLRHYVGAF